MLILLRHGESELNAGHRLAGRLDAKLTDAGRAQAVAAAAAVAALVGERPVQVVSSPLRRALETARAITDDVVIDARWIELDYGEYDGRPIADVPGALWRQWRSDASMALPGGESLETLARRVRGACDELAAEARDASLVVVSHVSPIKAAVAWALDVGIEVSWRLYLAPASITLIAFGPNGPSLQLFNQTGHLAQ